MRQSERGSYRVLVKSIDVTLLVLMVSFLVNDYEVIASEVSTELYV